MERENDAPARALKKDILSFDPVKYGNTKRIFEKIPYWNIYKSDLPDKRNSLERLIWLLSNPMESNKFDKKIALTLSLRQAVFATPSVDEHAIDKIIQSPSVNIDPAAKASNLSSGKFYIFPDLPDISGFGNINLAVRVSDLLMKSAVSIQSVAGNLAKEQWENFWLLFNLIQDSCILIEPAPSAGDTPEERVQDGKYACLENFDEDLHPIIITLIDEGIAFETEGSFFLNPENPFPEAALGFRHKKIVIRCLSNEDKKAFEDAGFTETEPINFNIESIR